MHTLLNIKNVKNLQLNISIFAPTAQRKLPEDGPDGPKHVGVNIEIF
jgi:hypothetical protein